MKRIKDLTIDELLGLAESEIEEIVDLESAHSGIPLPIHPGDAPKPLDVKKIDCFAIGGMIFLKMSEAVMVLEAISRCAVYTEDGYNETSRLRNVTNDEYSRPKIVTLHLTTPSSYAAIAGRPLEKYQYEKGLYDKANREYNETMKKRKAIEDTLYEAIREAESTEARRSYLDAKMNRYLELAGGNSDVAESFLKESETLSDTDLRYLGL